MQQRIWLLQDSYIKKITEKFYLTDLPFPKVLIDLEELTPYEGIIMVQEIYTYQQMVGSINYPTIITRPDVTYTVQRLVEFLTNPRPAHQAVA